MNSVHHRKFDRKNIVMACAVLINLHLGLSYAWSVFAGALIEQEGWTNAEAVLPSTIMAVSYSVSMLLFGFFQEKYGPRLTLYVGALLMGGGLLVAAQFMTVAGVAFGYGILHGCGVGACFSTTQATTLKWIPPERQGRVTGVISSAYGMSSVLMAVVAEFFIDRGGLQTAFYVIGTAIIAVVFLAGSFFRLPEPGQGYAKAVKVSADGPAEELDCRGMIRTRTFWMVLGVYIFGASAALVPINHISMITTIQGGLTSGYIFVGVLSVCNCLGRFGGGFLADRFSARNVLMVIAALNLVNLLLFGTYTSAAAFTAGCIIDGLHCGAIMALTPVLVSKHFGAKYCAQNYGLIACLGFINGFIGSQLAGVLADRFGSFQYGYLVCAAYLAAAVVLAWKLPKK